MVERMTYPGEEYATLVGLVEHYSPSGKEAQAASWLVGRMQALGYSQVSIDAAGNAVGVMGAGPRQVVLLGHIDTVEGEIPMRIDDGGLFGRGAVDAKGPLAAFVDAVASVGAVDGWQVVVIGAVDEERDSRGARYVVPLYHPEFAIIGEPSQWQRVTLGYKGSAWAKAMARRPRTHSASGQQSACEAALEGWGLVKAWVQEYNAGFERAFDHVSLSLRGMASGEDSLQEWASLEFNARLPLRLPPQDFYAQIERLCDGINIEPLGYAVPAYQAQKNTPLMRGFLSSIRAQGGAPSFVLKSGTADLNIVAPAWGCPALAYGPGDSALDHTPQEHLELEEYSRAVKVLIAVLQKLLQAS